MKTRWYYVLFMALVLAFFAYSTVYANTLDVENLNKYNFDDISTLNGQGNSLVQNMLSFGLYLLLISGICVLAFYTTRWISKHQQHLAIKSKYMEVIDALPLGKESTIYIVKAPQGLLMVGISQKGIFILDKLSPEEKEMIEEVEAGIFAPRSFANQLERLLLNKKVSHKDKNGDKT